MMLFSTLQQNNFFTNVPFFKCIWFWCRQFKAKLSNQVRVSQVHRAWKQSPINLQTFANVFPPPLDAAYKGTATRFSKVRATTEGEGLLFLWGLWNTGKCSARPSLQLILASFCKNNEIVWTEVFPHLPHWLNTHFQFPLHPHTTCTPPLNIYHFYMLPNSRFYLCSFLSPAEAYIVS